MTLETKDLPVFLRGSRSYVQGSQILGRTAEWLAEILPGGSIELTTAKFLHITDRDVRAVFDPQGTAVAAGLKDQIGEARYRHNSSTLNVHFYTSSSGQAQRIADVPSRIAGFKETGRLEGQAGYAIDGTHEGFLAAAIEIVKRLHAGLAPDVADIWFTGLALSRLPVDPVYPADGSVTVRLLLERPQDDRLLTLSRVETAGGQVPAFNIGFSCRAPARTKGAS